MWTFMVQGKMGKKASASRMSCIQLLPCRALHCQIPTRLQSSSRVPWMPWQACAVCSCRSSLMLQPPGVPVQDALTDRSDYQLRCIELFCQRARGFWNGCVFMIGLTMVIASALQSSLDSLLQANSKQNMHEEAVSFSSQFPRASCLSVLFDGNVQAAVAVDRP